jgi:hypothetical protein
MLSTIVGLDMQDMNKKTYENPNEAYFVDNIHDC